MAQHKPVMATFNRDLESLGIPLGVVLRKELLAALDLVLGYINLKSGVFNILRLADDKRRLPEHFL